jgi:hypothetical protein
MSDHITLEQFEKYVLHQLSKDARTRIDLHLSKCEGCCKLGMLTKVSLLIARDALSNNNNEKIEQA